MSIIIQIIFRALAVILIGWDLLSWWECGVFWGHCRQNTPHFPLNCVTPIRLTDHTHYM